MSLFFCCYCFCCDFVFDVGGDSSVGGGERPAVAAGTDAGAFASADHGFHSDHEPLVQRFAECGAVVVGDVGFLVDGAAHAVPLKFALPLMLVVTLLLAGMVTEPWITLSFLGVGYLATIPFSWLAYRKKLIDIEP